MYIIKQYFLKIYLLQSILNPASPQAEKIHRLYNFFNIAAAGMLLLVCFLVTYICIKFRQKKDDTTEAKPIKGNNKLEAVMIAVPALLLIWFFYETVSAMKFVAPSNTANRQPDVIITAHQWWWEVKYPSSNVTAANEVHLPAGKPLLLEMRSADVIHDWWVPALGNKMDMI
ncbi:MAG: cytochrome c oxidase subunit II, partial [Bacteroidota bacterium]|nr:cytochrome c oxidase subunit II [Bacteroidota bacterium]